MFLFFSGINFDKEEYGFLDKFSKNVERYGERDDIIGLLTRTEHPFRPVIISTLRKKFYLTSSRYREHYFDILSNGENVLKELETLTRNFDQQKKGSPGKNAGCSSSSITKNSTVKLRQNQQATDKSINKNQLVTDGPTKKNLLVTDGPSNKNNLESDGLNNKTRGSAYNISKKVWKP